MRLSPTTWIRPVTGLEPVASMDGLLSLTIAWNSPGACGTGQRPSDCDNSESIAIVSVSRTLWTDTLDLQIVPVLATTSRHPDRDKSWLRWSFGTASQRRCQDIPNGTKYRLLVSMLAGESGQHPARRKEPACIALYEQVLDLSEQIGDRRMSATCAYNLGTAYKDIPAIRDLNKAEQWSRRSLDLHDGRDGLGQGKCHNLLGNVRWNVSSRPGSSGSKWSQDLLTSTRQACPFTRPSR